MGAKKFSVDNIQKAVCHFKQQQSPLFLPFRLLSIILQAIYSHLASAFIKTANDSGRITVGFSNIYYNGNPRAVFEYMQSHPEKYDIFWCAKNMRTLKEVNKAGGKAFFVNGLLGLPYFLRADAWVVAHHGFGNIPLAKNGDCIKIMLWHGAGYKGHQRERNPSFYSHYDAWCTSSDWARERHISLWNAPPEKIYGTGYPRLDRLCHYLHGQDIKRSEILKELGLPPGAKIVLHAPTLGEKLWPWGEDEYRGFEAFCNFCGERGVHVVLRLHYYAHRTLDLHKIRDILKHQPNVSMLNMDREPDTEKILAIADVLVCGWSSIAIDFLATRRPIVYINLNKQRYTDGAKGEGLVPPHIRPGETAETETEFYEKLDISLRKNRFLDEQEKALGKIHGLVDGQASMRVARLIEHLVARKVNK